MFIHLHTHSYYSFLEGLASPESLARAAAREGMPALALTDYRGLSGAVEFYQACREQGVRPILGLQIDLLLPPDLSGTAGSRPDWLVLLAMDLEGWGSLCRLSSALQASEPAAPLLGLDIGTLEQHASGLICLAGGSKSLTAELILTSQERVLSSYLERLAACFPDRLYLSLQRHRPEDLWWNRALTSLAKQLHLPLAATHHVHYLRPEQANLQRLVSAMRLNLTLEALPPQAAAPPEASFVPSEEMKQRFADLPQALAATEEIASRCRLELPIGIPHFPQAPLPQGCRQLARQVGAGRKLNPESPTDGCKQLAAVFN